MKHPLWLLLFLLLACRREPEPVSKHDFTRKDFITISFPEEREFKLDSIRITSFAFSPVKANHLWVSTYTQDIYDLNLETNEWINIGHQFGQYYNGLKQEDIHTDPFDLDKVWFTRNSEGLLLYNVASNTQKVFPEVKGSCILTDTANVWIGTYKGLYRYDRKTEQLSVVDAVAEIYVQSLAVHSPGHLNVNGEYVYECGFGQLEKLQDLQANLPLTLPYDNLVASKDKYQYVTIKTKEGAILISFPYSIWKTVLFEEDAIWVPMNQLYDGLIRIDVKSQTAVATQLGYYMAVNNISSDSTYVWLCSQSEAMVIDKKSGEAFFWSLPYKSSRRILYQDSKNIYLNDIHSVIIIPKSKIVIQSTPLTRIKEEEALFNHLLDSTKIRQTRAFRSWYNSYKKIQSTFKETTSPRILANLEDIRASSANLLPDYYKPFDKSVFLYADTITEPEIRLPFINSLIIYAAQKGKMDRAIQLDNQLKLEFPALDTNDFVERQKIEIRYAYQALEALKGSGISEDERLWKTGNIYYRLFGYIGQETEASGMVMDYPFSFLTELLKKYPTSPWADNAAYLSFSYYEGSTHEGGDNDYNLEANEEYKKLILKYPDSELIPDIYYRIASLYADYGSGYDERKKYLKMAKKYVDKFYTEYPGHALTKEVDQFVSYLDIELDQLEWTLTISANKEKFSPTEPILITYQLTNEGNHAKTIRIYSDTLLSDFTHYVSYNPQRALEEPYYIKEEIHPQKLPAEWRDSTILAGDSFVKTKDITKWVKVESYGNQGFYNMKEGAYNVKAFFQLGSFNVSSNEIRFWRD